ncbi:hypothetical protein ACMFMG_007248 [Clarireedia jacksonii]
MGVRLHKLQESAYVVRRFELNHRGITNPWSIRQTGLYHYIKSDDSSFAPKLQRVNLQSRFLLIAASENAESKIAQYLKGGSSHKDQDMPLGHS